MNENISVLVIGATGFIGGHIAKQAVQQGWSVIGLRRDPAKTGHLASTSIQWKTGNLNDYGSLVDAMQDIDIVFHAGAYYPSQNQERSVNEQVRFARTQIDNVISAAKSAGVQKLIYTSTLATVFNADLSDTSPLDESDHYIPGTLPDSAYHETKIAMEQTVLNEGGKGISVTVLNPTAVFGPEDVYMTMASLLLAIAKGQVIFWLPGWVNIVDVRDVAQAHVSAASYGSDGERYILGGTNMPIREAINLVAKMTGKRPPKFRVPLWMIDALVVVVDTLPFLSMPTDHIRGLKYWKPYDNSKAIKELGLSPRPVEQTIEDALAWIHDEGFLVR